MRTGWLHIFQAHNDHSDQEMYQNELRLAVEAEEMGYDWLWAVEHHFFDYALSPDNMQYLSYVAARTERMQLGTGAVILPWNNPARVVEKMVLLDHLSNGRAVLGMGRGLARREYEAFGIDMAEARDRFNEAAEFVLRGLETGVVEGDGKYYPQERREIRPRILKSFAGRRYMVCVSPESFSVAASLDLGVMMFSQMPWELIADQIWAYRDEFQQHHGRPAPPILIADYVACFSDRDKAEEVALTNIVGYFNSVIAHYELDGAVFDKAGEAYRHWAEVSKQMNELGKDAAVEAILAANLWGTPDDIRAKLHYRRDLIGDFELNSVFSYSSLPYHDVEASMRLFAKEVAPEVQAWERTDAPRSDAVPSPVGVAD